MRLTSPALPWLLALLSMVARAARWQLGARVVDISHEAQVGLARALTGPDRLDLVLGGVHPGWAKAPLHPLLGAATGLVLSDPRPAAIALTWLYAALLIPLCAALARRLAGPSAGTGAALAVLALPFLAGDLREYGLAATLLLGGLLAVAALRDRPAAGRAAVLGLVVGLLACARWEALLWATLLLVGGLGWVLWSRPVPAGRGAALVAATALPAALAVAAVGAVAYPTSGLPERLAERLQLNGVMARAFGGMTLQGTDIDLVSRAGQGGPLDAAADVGFLQAWLHALPGALGALLAMALHPLTWPVWVLAVLGARRLGRRGGLLLAALALPVLALSFMPAKPAYLLLPGCGLAVLAGAGTAFLAPVRQRLAWVILALCTVGSLARAHLDPDLAQRMLRLGRTASKLRSSLPPGQALLAEEDLCVLLMDRHPCTFLPPQVDPDDPAAQAWLRAVDAQVAVVDDTVPELLRALAPISAQTPRPISDHWSLVPLSPVAQRRPPP